MLFLRADPEDLQVTDLRASGREEGDGGVVAVGSIGSHIMFKDIYIFIILAQIFPDRGERS